MQELKKYFPLILITAIFFGVFFFGSYDNKVDAILIFSYISALYVGAKIAKKTD